MADQSRQLNVDPAPTDHREGKRALGEHLTKKFTTYKADRTAAEQQWLVNTRQYLGKYDPEYESKMAPNTSRAYPKRTRVKCVSMKSRLADLLFPASEKNWSLEPSPVPTLPADTLAKVLVEWQQANQGARPTQLVMDELVMKTARDISELQERIITDQLKDVNPYGSCDYETLCGQVLESGVRYGPGVVKGPMAVADTVSKIFVDAGGVPHVIEEQAYRPYFEFVNCWDYFPDMTAKLFEQMDGEFQRHVHSKQQLTQLAKRSDFDGELIREFMRTNPSGNYVKLSYENQLDAVGGQGLNVLPKGKKFELLEFWGSTTAEYLRAAGVTVDENVDDEEDVRFTAWVLGEYTIKVGVNPLPYGTKVFHQFVFEQDEINLLGSGLPPIMRDSQLAVASFSRMLIDNAAAVCGPNVEVNTDRLSPSMTDMTIAPFKVWPTEDANGQQVVRSISFDSHIAELLQAIERFDSFADGETFVNPATGGDMDGVPGEAFRTTGGASMIYGNAALPFKDIVRNFDRFTVSVIHALVQWNRLMHADADQLQGDVRPIARGATSLMAKEMRSFAMDNLAQTMSPEEREWINTKELLKERLKVRDLSDTGLLNSDADVQAKQQAAAQQSQQQFQQQMAMLMAEIKNMEADTVKQLSQAQKNLDTADVNVFNAMVNALKDGTSPDDLARVAQRAIQSRQVQPGPPAVAGPAPVPQLPAPQVG